MEKINIFKELAYAEENDLKDLTNAKKQEALAQNGNEFGEDINSGTRFSKNIVG